MTNEINLEDLVVLRFIGDSRCVEILKFKDRNLHEPDLSIGIELETWNYSVLYHCSRTEFKNIPLGKARSGQKDEIEFGVIGVYNIKSHEHIQSMVSDATKFSKEPANFYIDG